MPINSATAFQLIPTAIEIVLSNPTLPKLAQALSLLSELAYLSTTTELPEELKLAWTKLEKIAQTNIDNCDVKLYWEGICEWYRIKN